MRSSVTVGVIFALCCIVSTSNGQLDAVKNAVGGAAECIQKLPQCSPKKPSESERDQRKTYCCGIAAWSKCVENLIDSTCPGTALNQVVNMPESGQPGTYCEGYTFWTPECLYTNYMIVVIGSAAGLAVLLLIIIIAICCCCCRSKK